MPLDECRGMQLVYTKPKRYDPQWRKSVGVNWSVLKPRYLTDRQFDYSKYTVSVKQVRENHVDFQTYSSDHEEGKVMFYTLPQGKKFKAIDGLLVTVKATIEWGEEGAPRNMSFVCYKNMWLPSTGRQGQRMWILTVCSNPSN